MLDEVDLSPVLLLHLAVNLVQVPPGVGARGGQILDLDLNMSLEIFFFKTRCERPWPKFLPFTLKCIQLR